MLGKRLSYNSTIGIISPASPENIKAIHRGISFLRNKGFTVLEAKHLYDKWGYLAGTDQDRASDLMEMFKNKDVDMILCIRGGYGSTRILPYLDFDIIRQNPKIFAGFSDITIFLNLFYERCGFITFHSPMGSSNFEDSDTYKSFNSTLMEGVNPYQIINPVGTATSYIVKGNADGHLIGGNLSLLCNTLGTPYEISTKDKILFIEEVNEEPYKIDRMLTHLLMANKIQQCSGIILGQFKDCTLPDYVTSLHLEEVLKDRLEPLGIPILTNFSSGHDYPKLTLPIGAHINFSTFTGTINVLEPVVK